jgi:hypothetical protein
MMRNVGNPLGRRVLGQADNNSADNDLNTVKRHSQSIRNHSEFGKACPRRLSRSALPFSTVHQEDS